MMHYRLPLLMLLCAPFAVSCFQEIDTGAAKGNALSAAPDTKEPTFTTALDTPPIDVDPAGDITRNPCNVAQLQVDSILSTNCGTCHSGENAGARQGVPPFDYLFDLGKLETATSENNMDSVTKKPFRFLWPGQADRSRIFVRISMGEMPPADLPGGPVYPRPTLSDMSVIRNWITNCIGNEPLPAAAGAPTN